MANKGRFAIETSGAGEFDQLTATIELWFLKLEDMAPAIEAAAAEYKSWIDIAFDGELDPNTGTRWAPLSQRSMKDREKAGFANKKKLRRTEYLYTAVTGEFQKLYKEAGIGVTTFFLIIDTSANSDDNDNYAYINNYGGENSKGKQIPPRPFMLDEVRLTGALYRSALGYLTGGSNEALNGPKFTALDKLYGQGITKYGSGGTFKAVNDTNMASYDSSLASAANENHYGVF